MADSNSASGLGDVLDVLCPMHVLLDATGHILQAGPTMHKLLVDKRLVGARFLELFELQRPRAVTTMPQLMAQQGVKLHLRLRDNHATAFKAVLVGHPSGEGAIVNLSFGISVMDSVRDYGLTSADFAATDLAIEMLYLIEAKTAAMAASRKLNQRLQGAKIAAQEQAFTDTLTGLKNRRAMDHVLARLLSVEAEFSMMHLDLDYFKAVNDTLGHGAGDYVLQEVAQILVAETRNEDTVARVGGDEFVLLFNRLTDVAKLDDIALRIIARLEEPIPFNDEVCRISGSVGTVICDKGGIADAEQLLADADVALYASKHKGRACHTIYSPALREMSVDPPKGR